MKYFRNFILLFVMLVSLNYSTTYAIESYTDKFEDTISNEIVSYNGIVNFLGNLCMKGTANIVYNIKDADYITVTFKASASTVPYLNEGQLYITLDYPEKATLMKDYTTFVSGGKVYLKDKNRNIYEENIEMAIADIPYKKTDKDIKMEKYFGINVYSVNKKGKKSLLNKVKTNVNLTDGYDRYIIESTFYCPNKETEKIIIDSDSADYNFGIGLLKASFNGKNMIIGDRPKETPHIPEKPTNDDKTPNKDTQKDDNQEDNKGENIIPDIQNDVTQVRPKRHKYSDYDILSDSHKYDIEEPIIDINNITQDKRYNDNKDANSTKEKSTSKTNAKNKKSTSTQKSKKLNTNKEKSKVNKKEENDDIVIKYDENVNSNQSESFKLEKIIAISSIACGGIVALKIAGSGFFKAKK